MSNMRGLYFLGFIVGIIFFLGCNKLQVSKNKVKVIILQPFDGISQKEISELQEQMNNIAFQIKVNNPIQLPEKAYYPERRRYRADSVIRFLKDRVGDDTIIIGITDKDISITKGKYKDWGVMGLGYRPGKSCVVSTFRISKKNKKEQLYKVVAHEFGHTIGLDHCKNKTCIMRDAEGGNPLDEEKDFCQDCKKFLKKEGVLKS